MTKREHEEIDVRKNGSGCNDPTACRAIQEVDWENARFYKLLDTIFNICDLSGFHLEGRITVKDKETGRVWK